MLGACASCPGHRCVSAAHTGARFHALRALSAYVIPRALGHTDVCCALRRFSRKGMASVFPLIANSRLAGLFFPVQAGD